MKNTKKRMLSFGCSVLLLAGMMIPTGNAVAAEEFDGSHMQKVLEENSTYEGFLASGDTLTYEELLTLPGTSVRSEFESIEEMKKMPSEKLHKMGLTSEDVQMIKTEETSDIILEHAASLTNEELQKKGLSSDTIKKIKEGNFEAVSDSDIQKASTQLAFNIASVARSGNSANFNIYWHWDVEPTLKYEDYVTGSISDGYWPTGTCTAILYYNDEAGVLGQTETRIGPSATGNSVKFTFPMRQYTSLGPRYCAAGKAFVGTLGNYSPDWSLIANADYFHSYTKEGLTISFGYGPVSFSGNGSHEGSAVYYIDK